MWRGRECVYEAGLLCLPDDYNKGYCHHRRDDINSSLRRLDCERPALSFTCLPVWSFLNCSPARPSSRLTSSEPRTGKCFLSWRVFSSRRNAISLWSRYPHRLLLYPQWKWHFTKCHFARVLHGSSLAQGGIILLVKRSFRQCGPVGVVLHLAREALKGYTSVSCLSAPVVVSSFCCTTRQKGCELGRVGWWWGEGGGGDPTVTAKSHVFSHEWGD